MAYELLIGERLYSSWSLRGWLVFAAFDLPVHVHRAHIYGDDFKTKLADFAPAQLVPVARLDGAVIWDSLAIAEELYSRHPDCQMWPDDRAARAMARAISAEMHSGFTALRAQCGMNMRVAYSDFKPSQQVQMERDRIEMLWAMARDKFGADGPWLFGAYSIADAFYAPVAMRFATYDLASTAQARAYVQAHLHHQPLRQWRAMGLANGDYIPRYEDAQHSQKQWPGPVPLRAQKVEGRQAENKTCPYSGDKITHVMQIAQRRFGFCKEFCRDKTVADPLAWPKFVEIYEN